MNLLEKEADRVSVVICPVCGIEQGVILPADSESSEYECKKCGEKQSINLSAVAVFND